MLEAGPVYNRLGIVNCEKAEAFRKKADVINDYLQQVSLTTHTLALAYGIPMKTQIHKDLHIHVYSYTRNPAALKTVCAQVSFYRHCTGRHCC